ncbi:MAG: VCBS repeat-containing protein [candidate division Zixibacteria bacterium]|nr:VCBS repeat-containing protein [Candidatus Tariuqbacter arcticus]
MKYAIIFSFILCPIFLFAQGEDFTLEVDAFPFEIEGWEPFVPWVGGYSSCTPEFVDIEADGDLDLFVGGGTSYISYYENIGVPTLAEYCFVTYAFDSIDAEGGMVKPSFVDIDADDDYDLFILSTYYSKLYINQGTSICPQFILNTINLLSSIDITGADFVDIDSDGDFDVIAGEFYGNILLYINIGTNQVWEYDEPIIMLENLISSGWIKPSLCDIDNDGDFDLFLGMDNGDLYFYLNEGDSANYDFVFVTDDFAGASVPYECAPTFCDIDADGDYDLFCGMDVGGSQDPPSGNISFHRNVGTPEVYDYEEITYNYLCFDIGGQCQPYLVDIDNDGDLDLLPGRGNGNLPFIRNVGTVDSPSFVWEEYPFFEPDVNFGVHITFGDMDADGDYDMFIGTETLLHAWISYYKNRGTPEEPDMVLSVLNYFDYWDTSVFPDLVDIDADGDLDLMVGTMEAEGTIFFYQNIGTPDSMDFQLVTTNYQGITSYGHLRPHFVDYDYDGDYDLFTTYGYGIKYYENIGSPEIANFILVTDEFAGIDDYTGGVFFSDIDNDGDLDLFSGQYAGGGIKYYRNNEYNSVNSHPQIQPNTFTLHQNYPNPFNVSTTISFTLDRALPVRMVVYNQLGQCVVTLVDGQMTSGEHQIRWDAGMCSSGVYLIALESESIPSQARKVMLIK